MNIVKIRYQSRDHDIDLVYLTDCVIIDKDPNQEEWPKLCLPKKKEKVGNKKEIDKL